LACIEIEENSVFKLCSGLVDDWKEEVKRSNANSPRDAHLHEQGKTNLEAKTISSLIKTFERLIIVEQDCVDRRLNSEVSKLQAKVKAKIECNVANCCQQKELEHKFDEIKKQQLADLVWMDYFELRKVLIRIKPYQLGSSMCCWKEAKMKIDKVDHLQARNVLFSYIADANC